jgi:putative ABC transport system permease protein
MKLKHVLRRLFKAPMFTAITVLTLAIGIGANSTIFALIKGVLLNPLPYARPEELVDVDHAAPGVNLASAGASPFLYFTYREESHTFQDIALWQRGTKTLTGRAEPEELVSLDVTDGFLPILGVQPLLGRLFSPQDDKPGSPDTVLLNYGLWRTKFGGDPAVVGRRILLDGKAHEVIGVLPEKFRFLDFKPGILVPLQFDRGKTFLGNFSYQAVARLRPGVTLAQANADASRMIPIALHRFPPFPGYSEKMFEEARLAPALRPLKQSVLGDIGKVLWVLMGTVGMVLLIACANVANLMLVRVQGREHELAIRAALGAGWRQIVGELLLESLTLGVLGGVLGLGIAYGALRLLISLGPANLPRLDEVAMDGRAILFTFGISLVAGVLFGLVPAIKYAGPQIALALRAGGRSMSQSRERRRARNILVVVQVALALVLLISSGLMIRTFQALKHVDPGFVRPDEVLTMRISIPSSAVRDPVSVVRMEQAIADKIAAIPGVSSVGLSSAVPMTGDSWNDPLFAQDKVYSEGEIPPLRQFKMVSPGLLRTMGNTLLAGRDFTWTDVYEKRPVVMVSENYAREVWQDPGNAIGKRIRENMKGPWREIVGVISDQRDKGINQKAPTIALFPLLMDNFEGDEVFCRRTLAYMVRSNRAGSSGLVADIGKAVWSVNPDLPLANVRTLREIYDKSLGRTSFALVMLAIAGAMALLLGVAGIYGVISYSVAQRTREIGIRIALGAQNREVTGMFVRQGAALAVVGIVFGIVAAVALTRLMSSLLFGVKPFDTVTFAGVSLGLALAAVLASYAPASRAASIDPVEALRAE